MATQAGTRLAYEKAKAAVQAAGFSIDTAVLSQSYLRSEVVLSTGKTQYQFPILINDNSQPITNTSQLLNLQDAFYVSQLFIGFAKAPSATSSEFKLNTYPDTTVFTEAEATALYSFYNGSLQLTVNNRQIVSAYNVSRHLFVGQTQGVDDATNPELSTIAQQDGSSSGFYPIEPGLVLVGSKQNVLTINIPQGLTNVAANSRCVVIFSGHLAQNVTPVR